MSALLIFICIFLMLSAESLITVTDKSGYCTYIDIQKVNIKSLVMHMVQMHTGAISWLEYGSCICTGNNPLTDACGLSSRTDVKTIL